MKRNRNWISVVFLCVLAAVIAVDAWANAQDYPKPVGYVNDFANLLSQEEGRKLNAELAAYDSATTIEITVVTVQSLSGMSAEYYSLGLANAWGVGKKEKNNGVVILIAPNDRDGWIQIGRGLERTLSERSVQGIYDREMTPRFKAGKMSEGILAGTHSLMEKLASTSAQTEKTGPESEGISGKYLLFVLSVIVGLIGVIIFFSWLFGRIGTRKENVSRLDACKKKLRQLKDGYSLAKSRLDALKSENPEPVWADLEKKFLALTLWDLEAALRQAQIDCEAGWKMINSASDSLLELQRRLDGYLWLYQRIEAKVAEVEKAKEKAPALLEKMPGMIEAAEKKLGSSASESARARLTEARTKYAQAQAQAKGGTVDWLTVLLLLNAVHSLCEPRSNQSGYSGDHSPSRHHDDATGGGGNYGSFGGGSFGGHGAGGKW